MDKKARRRLARKESHIKHVAEEEKADRIEGAKGENATARRGGVSNLEKWDVCTRTCERLNVTAEKEGFVTNQPL